MPELPEVETVVRQLRPLLSGGRLLALSLLDPRCPRGPVQRAVGRRVSAVRRLGKQVVLTLDHDEAGQRGYLAVHLRMTGRLLWRGQRAPAALPHLRARLRLDQGTLDFVDVRRFGTLRWEERLAPLRPLGLDPTASTFTARRLGRLLQGSGQQLKVWLLRQDRLVGLGNIYAAEILFRARLNPWRRAGSLTADEVTRLHRALRRVLREAVQHCGTTFSDFQQASGLTGSYQRYLRVYRREGEPCPVCAGAVVREVQQGRSTFYCPHCQPGSGGIAIAG